MYFESSEQLLVSGAGTPNIERDLASMCSDIPRPGLLVPSASVSLPVLSVLMQQPVIEVLQQPLEKK